MHPTSRHLAASTMAVVVLVGCASAALDDRPATTGPTRAPGGSVWPAVPEQASPPAEAPDLAPSRPQRQTGSSGRDAVEQAAAGTIIALFDDEQLTVFDLTIHELDDSTVQVEVLHGTGRSYPHASRYQITLTATDDGGWRAEQIVVAP